MSAGIIPDMYRHTARKTTVSKTIKSSNVSLCNNPPTHYSPYNIDTNCKQQTIFDTITCNIKLEEDIPQPQEPFIILPDNEIEQMIIGEDFEQTNEEIINNIMEEILNEITQFSSSIILSTSDQVFNSYKQINIRFSRFYLDKTNYFNKYSGCS
jgi:hypothetical protein